MSEASRISLGQTLQAPDQIQTQGLLADLVLVHQVGLEPVALRYKQELQKWPSGIAILINLSILRQAPEHTRRKPLNRRRGEKLRDEWNFTKQLN
jgi:hypothetical protein